MVQAEQFLLVLVTLSLLRLPDRVDVYIVHYSSQFIAGFNSLESRLGVCAGSKNEGEIAHPSGSFYDIVELHSRTDGRFLRS